MRALLGCTICAMHTKTVSHFIRASHLMPHLLQWPNAAGLQAHEAASLHDNGLSASGGVLANPHDGISVSLPQHACCNLDPVAAGTDSLISPYIERTMLRSHVWTRRRDKQKQVISIPQQRLLSCEEPDRAIASASASASHRSARVGL